MSNGRAAGVGLNSNIQVIKHRLVINALKVKSTGWMKPHPFRADIKIVLSVFINHILMVLTQFEAPPPHIKLIFSSCGC